VVGWAAVRVAVWSTAGGLPLSPGLLTGVTGLLALLAIYLWLVRPWQLRWGATDEEVARPMPGDEIVPRPTFNATRAVTVNGRPEDIWPWIVQIGFGGAGRAGWYSYDLIDNLGRRSAERVIPELQHIEVGDFIPIFGKTGFWVKAFSPNGWILWGDKGRNNLTWLWALHPIDGNRTRLITRVRLRYVWTSSEILFNLVLDVGDIVMMRKCLLGIKRRAEELTRARTAKAQGRRGSRRQG
jgi:hypothetical protein